MDGLRERMVRERARFIEDYDNNVDQARLDLGKLFRIEDYPSKEALQGKFSIRYRITAVQDAEQFMAKLASDDVDRVTPVSLSMVTSPWKPRRRTCLSPSRAALRAFIGAMRHAAKVRHRDPPGAHRGPRPAAPVRRGGSGRARWSLTLPTRVFPATECCGRGISSPSPCGGARASRRHRSRGVYGVVADPPLRLSRRPRPGCCRRRIAMSLELRGKEAERGSRRSAAPADTRALLPEPRVSSARAVAMPPVSHPCEDVHGGLLGNVVANATMPFGRQRERRRYARLRTSRIANTTYLLSAVRIPQRHFAAARPAEIMEPDRGPLFLFTRSEAVRLTRKPSQATARHSPKVATHAPAIPCFTIGSYRSSSYSAHAR